jgi:membrane protein implicated in regulation of membrane protease activity
MAEQIDSSGQIPPAGEPIHLPGPSYLPVIVAAGTAIALVGVVLSWFVFAAGLVITLVAVARWVREMRSEMADLPLEHTSH